MLRRRQAKLGRLCGAGQRGQWLTTDRLLRDAEYFRARMEHIEGAATLGEHLFTIAREKQEQEQKGDGDQGEKRPPEKANQLLEQQSRKPSTDMAILDKDPT